MLRGPECGFKGGRHDVNVGFVAASGLETANWRPIKCLNHLGTSLLKTVFGKGEREWIEILTLGVNVGTR